MSSHLFIVLVELVEVLRDFSLAFLAGNKQCLMILGHFCPHEKIEATKHSLKVLLVDDLLTLHLETGAGIVWTAVSLIPISIAGVRLVEGGS